ncbi:hypothetical protein [Halalkalicoccus sp. NIPERK01]|uniref:hypothetical protein n=1 Tax=Halalkalicoccus sp. NIPERK01 TaxID=3053469 RepID=UPI00256EB295|nr:hypothetical protein [Halalkalicoccus sp. NIPERK01]MDL5362681.1 hypothetical protein [Halalkalicoccus sp. NIPERK01]
MDLGDVRLWLLLKLNRWALAGAVLAVVFGSLVVATMADIGPVRALIASHDALWWIFSSFIGAIITGVTLVATIGQLVLSQELGAVGDQRERMEDAMEFRSDIEETTDLAVSPPEPAAFLQLLVDRTETQAERLRDVVEDERDEELREKIDDYVDNLAENGDEVSESLEGAQFGTFEVLWAAFKFNYSWKIFSARRIRNDHRESLSAEAEEAFDDTIELLKLFGPAREHFKTLYFQWELINVARALLYVSVPALIVVGAILMNVGPGSFPGRTFGVDNLVWVAAFGFTVGVTPFVILLSYVLRIMTLAKRTLAMGPFILREAEREEDIDWS